MDVDVEQHEHACLFHRSWTEQADALAAYMRDAFARNERFVYVLDRGGDTGVFERLRHAGIDVEDALDDGALILRTADGTYFADGHFDPDRVIALLREVEREAREDGFDGVRVTGEMTWALAGGAGSDRLLEYETRLNDVLPGLRASAICQYDVRWFPSAVLEDMARAHAVVIREGHVSRQRVGLDFL